MLGAILGDIIGSRWEFNPTNDYNFELFSDKNSFTDDTICTIAVADALLQGRDYGESIHDWCRRYPYPMGGYGGRFAAWVKSDNPQPYGSFGNGSAMRVSPVAWWFGNELSVEAGKTAACTHNHKEGIRGAEAVALAIYGARQLRRQFRNNLTPKLLLKYGLPDAVGLYDSPDSFHVDIEQYRNKFDETCQGTVPVALWIALHSTGFEDAIRQAVSLGGDADTLGAIVGSIAEALWGIPDWMIKKAMSYLPDEMRAVVNEFHDRVARQKDLSILCQYYTFSRKGFVKKEHRCVYDIEMKWTLDLGANFTNAETEKMKMSERFDINDWQLLADEYDLPLSLIGYIARDTLKPKHKTLMVVRKFLEAHYAMRKPEAEKKKKAKKEIAMAEAIMRWKLGLGNMNKVLYGKDPIPGKTKVATAGMFADCDPMPDDPDQVSEIKPNIPITAGEMNVLRLGHIPESQEDHWTMYCDDEYIRYYRSWSGILSFEAHYIKVGEDYMVDLLKISHTLMEFGVNGTIPAMYLFRYLLTAELGYKPEKAWDAYMHEWEKMNAKYQQKKK